MDSSTGYYQMEILDRLANVIHSLWGPCGEQKLSGSGYMQSSMSAGGGGQGEDHQGLHDMFRMSELDAERHTETACLRHLKSL